MTNWKQNLSFVQNVAIRIFLTIVGMVLMVLAFYEVTLEKIQHVEQSLRWHVIEWNYCYAGSFFLWVALDLGRFSKIVDWISIKVGFKKSDNAR